MIRILLPLAMVAAMFFGPMYTYPSDNPVSGREEIRQVPGSEFMGGVIDCVRQLQVPLGKACASEGEINGSKSISHIMSLAAIAALVAAVLGVVGLIPVVGRVTSIVTLAAGVVVLGAMGYFVMLMIGSKVGLGGVYWGTYLTAGLSLLTIISGLSGMRGR
jgi:hypothetical protein